MPPTVEEVTAFEKDPSDQNYEAAIDRLLASGRGESIPWERFPWNLRNGYRILKIPPEKRSSEQQYNVEALLFYDHPATGPHEKALDRLKEERDALVAHTMVMKDAENPVPTHVFIRGAYTSPGEPVEPGTPMCSTPSTRTCRPTASASPDGSSTPKIRSPPASP